MDKKLKKRIKSLGPWYQGIDFDGIITVEKSVSTIELWKDIRKTLPKTLEGMRILDIGANAGHFSVQAALLGAQEVVSVDWSEKYYSQFLFVKNFFEKKHGSLNITYINKNISHVNFEQLGRFDYIFALSVLYHIGRAEYGRGSPKALEEQIRVIESLTQISDNIIVRCKVRKYNDTKYYNKIFSKFGFESKIIKAEEFRKLLLYTPT